MPELSEDVEESVTRVRVQVRADAFVYEGLVTLLAESDRLQTVLNDPRPFLNMTDVAVFDATTGTTYNTPYLALNKGAITHVVLVAEGLSEGVVSPSFGGTPSPPSSEVPVVAGATLPPQSPPPSPIVRPPAPPPARRVPKVPVLRRDDPPTQPFPGLESELSGLSLDDDDDDDIDPADLLGASGDYTTRSLGD